MENMEETPGWIKVSWTVNSEKIGEYYGRKKVSWIVKRYGHYGRKVSRIVKR